MPNRLSTDESDRWGAPLAQLMWRTLVQDLTSRLPPGVFIFPDAPEPPDTRMLVVTVLDAETDASGTVTLQAAWTLQSGQPARATLTQQATLENRGTPIGRHEWLHDAGLSIMYAYFRRSYGPGSFDGEGGVPSREWRIKRNCSLTPRQSLAATVFLMALDLAIGVVTAFAFGAWLTLFFSMLCTVAVGIAFIAYSRHATDGEVLTFAPPFVIVEVHERGRRTMHRMNAGRLAVSLDDSDGVVYLCDGWQRIPVGRQLPAAARAEFVRQLRRFIVADC